MMTSDWKKRILTLSLLLMFSLAAMTACASNGGGDECDDGTIDCKEQEVQDLPV